MEVMRAKLFFLLATILLVGCEEQKRPNTAPASEAIAPPITAPAPQVTTKIEPPPQQALAPDPVDVTIEQAEKEFQAGQENYTAGHLDAAKQNFDHAFDILTQGPVEVRSNEKLKQECDELVERATALGGGALTVRDGVTEQKAEPAACDESD